MQFQQLLETLETRIVAALQRANPSYSATAFETPEMFAAWYVQFDSDFFFSLFFTFVLARSGRRARSTSASR